MNFNSIMRGATQILEANEGKRRVRTRKRSNYENRRKVYLNNWRFFGRGFNIWLEGNVHGHPRLINSQYITTTPIDDLEVILEEECFRVQTRNTLYTLPFSWAKAYENYDFVFNLDYSFISNEILYILECITGVDLDVKEEEMSSELTGAMEKVINGLTGEEEHVEELKNALLLHLGDTNTYYFDMGFYFDSSSIVQKLKYVPHVGMFQDSILIRGLEYDDTVNRLLDFRYFPHPNNRIHFYSTRSSDCLESFGIKNTGIDPLYVSIYDSVYCIESGETREINEDVKVNEGKSNMFFEGDLYPAVFLDFDDDDE